jgi:aminoglycoside phosphotransferase (APT) family kinase protein
MHTIMDLPARLEVFLAEKTQAPVQVVEVRHLTGGASRDTWALDAIVESGSWAGRHALVLRRDLGGVIDDSALSRAQEFRLLEVAHAAGILVPRPYWLCTDPAVLDVPFFLMARLEGESVGRRIVREVSLAEARQRLPRQMAEQLARIHALPRGGLTFLPCPIAGQSPAATAVENADRQLQSFGEPHPVLELAIRWLRARAPACPSPVLVHGDFRIGNLMVGVDGLRGVFDWEFARVGDPVEDLAWPCVRSWRFGQDSLRLGGIAPAEEFLQTYEQLSGRVIDRSALHYWEVLGNLRWAVGCIAQANRHLTGQTASIELASLGRRTAEMELELLDLMSEPEA